MAESEVIAVPRDQFPDVEFAGDGEPSAARLKLLDVVPDGFSEQSLRPVWPSTETSNRSGALLETHSYRLIAKSSFLSFVPFISSRIQTGVIPRPDHFRLLFFLL